MFPGWRADLVERDAMLDRRNRRGGYIAPCAPPMRRGERAELPRRALAWALGSPVVLVVIPAAVAVLVAILL